MFITLFPHEPQTAVICFLANTYVYVNDNLFAYFSGKKKKKKGFRTQ